MIGRIFQTPVLFVTLLGACSGGTAAKPATGSSVGGADAEGGLVKDLSVAERDALVREFAAAPEQLDWATLRPQACVYLATQAPETGDSAPTDLVGACRADYDACLATPLEPAAVTTPTPVDMNRGFPKFILTDEPLDAAKLATCDAPVAAFHACATAPFDPAATVAACDGFADKGAAGDPAVKAYAAELHGMSDACKAVWACGAY